MFFISDFNCKGLCIIPIETKLVRTGLVRDMINIPYLDDIIELSNRRNLYVKYLSKSKGLVDYDTYIEHENKRTGSVLYPRLVAEQVYRECLDRSASTVYYMGRKSDNISLDLIHSMELYGIEVIAPIMGFSIKAIPNVLLFYR